jgi:hypothetical protein
MPEATVPVIAKTYAKTAIMANSAPRVFVFAKAANL